MSKMTERLHRAINTELRRALDYILAPLYDVLLMLPTEQQNVLKSLSNLIDDDYFSSMYEFKEILDTSFFIPLFTMFGDLLKYKHLVMVKMKRVILEKAVTSILEDLERLPQADREQYTENNKNLLQNGMQEPQLIDFTVFDIDAIVDQQRALVRSLQHRDEVWFNHFRD